MLNIDAINKIKIGDHVCSIYKDRELLLCHAAAFIKSGIENWEKCLYFGNLREIIERLEKMGVDKKYIHSRQLILIPGEKILMQRYSLLKEYLELAMKDGFRCLRVAQEMIPSAEIFEYETELNGFFLKNTAICLCLYEEKKFPGEILLRSVKAHPKVFVDDYLCENQYYFSPLEKDIEKELDAYLGILKDKTILKNQHLECEIHSMDILKERTKKLKDSRDALFNMLKDMDESYKKLQKAYEELQTLDKMKDEFISNVSHELKTPLISIKGYGELLCDEKLGKLSDEQKKSLDAIIRNADRLSRLINSILFISKMKAGKIEFHLEAVDLNEVLMVCMADFKNMMDKKQISFEKIIPEISKVKGERDKFIEVIHNLLDNALKFTSVGGKISIKAYEEVENVHLTISDTGIGIPEELIPKLFMRFFQIDGSTSRKFGGMGLGLYISKSIIDAFGGKIWIESDVGKGTTVHVLLPIAGENGSIN